MDIETSPQGQQPFSIIDHGVRTRPNNGASLLDVPDELLASIFLDLVRLPPARASSRADTESLQCRALYDHGANAFALACTCRRMLRIFSSTCLRSLAPHASSLDSVLKYSSTQTPSFTTESSPSLMSSIAHGLPHVSSVTAWSGAPTEMTSRRAGARPLRVPPSATCILHICNLVRLAGPELRKLTLNAFPPKRPQTHQPVLGQPNRRGYAIRHLEPGELLRELGQSAVALEELHMPHPELIFSERSAQYLHLLFQARYLTLRALHIRGIDALCATALLAVQPRLVALRELRIPGFKAGFSFLRQLIEGYGPVLESFELSVVERREENANLPSDAELSSLARYFYGLTYLRIGPLGPGLAKLGPLLVQACSKLRSLTLHRLSGNLTNNDCLTMTLIRAATASCRDLEQIHMMDCNVTGESAELFQIVGVKLKSFTGAFYWETAEELIVFADNCPRVESFTLRCGHETNHGSRCDEGAVVTCKRFGPNIRSLLISNTNIDELSFVDAVCAATNVEELELVCSPKLRVGVMEKVLHAVGSSVRILTIEWNQGAEQSPIDEDIELLLAISRFCPLLEFLCIPELFDRAQLNGEDTAKAHCALGTLEEKLPYLDLAGSTLGTVAGS